MMIPILIEGPNPHPFGWLSWVGVISYGVFFALLLAGYIRDKREEVKE